MTFLQNFFLTTTVFCSIPEDQKPMNEYLETKENLFLNWSSSNSKRYQKTLFFIAFLFFSLNVLFFFDFEKNFFEQTKSTFLYIFSASIYFFFLFFLFLFLRWRELNLRFENSRLFYEESSWFDGQIWEKPLFLLKNDRFLSKLKIFPILKRIFKTFLKIIVFSSFFLFFYF